MPPSTICSGCDKKSHSFENCDTNNGCSGCFVEGENYCHHYRIYKKDGETVKDIEYELMLKQQEEQKATEL